LIARLPPVSFTISSKGVRTRMSATQNSSHWLDTWWPLFVILFGILFVSWLVSFHPSY
jgi:hypothetical protein